MRLFSCFLLASLFSVPAFAADPPAAPAAPAAHRTHLFICSGQSNMVYLDLKLSFTPTLKQAFPNDEIIVVQHAADGQPISRFYKNCKNPDGKPVPNAGDIYDLIMSQSVKPAMQGKTIDTVTFVWMQGESDGIELHGEPPGRGKIYAANLRGLIAQLSGDLKRPDLNVVIGRISSKFSDDPKHPDWDAVRKAQVEVAESNPRYRWVNTDDLNGPDKGIHYTPDGKKELGRRFALAAIDIINKPPKPKSADAKSAPKPAK